MPQAQRTPEGEQRWREVTDRAKSRAKKYFDRIHEFVQRTGTLVLDEGELTKLLTGFALDERKREEHEKRQAAQMNQPYVTDEDQRFAELLAAEMRHAPDGLRSDDLWLRFVAKGISRARAHWEGNHKSPPDPTPHYAPVAKQENATKPAGCYEKGRATGEPTFTLLARDVSAPWVVFEWVRRNWHHCRPEKLADAIAIAQAMERWPSKKAAD